MASIYRKSEIPEELLVFFEPAEIGLEDTPDAFVGRLVDVFREVRRVLRDDGTAWVNMGDSYAMSTRGAGGTGKQQTNAGSVLSDRSWRVPDGIKPKDLLGIPWMLAFALRADGWYLRSDVIWHKPNPMPESVTDRPTKAHEYIFLLSKSARYFYDADAIREASSEPPARYSWEERKARGEAIRRGDPASSGGHKTSGGLATQAGRNKRTVWTVTPKPFKGAHFATFPPDLIEPCIKAGTSERGACAECGAPWERVVERIADKHNPGAAAERLRAAGGAISGGTARSTLGVTQSVQRTSRNWRPTCAHDAGVVPCAVLDPFFGAGTTGLVANRLGRDAIGIELNPTYAQMARERIDGDVPPEPKRPRRPRPAKAPPTGAVSFFDLMERVK